MNNIKRLKLEKKGNSIAFSALTKLPGDNKKIVTPIKKLININQILKGIFWILLEFKSSNNHNIKITTIVNINCNPDVPTNIAKNINAIVSKDPKATFSSFRIFTFIRKSKHKNINTAVVVQR